MEIANDISFWSEPGPDEPSQRYIEHSVALPIVPQSLFAKCWLYIAFFQLESIVNFESFELDSPNASRNIIYSSNSLRSEN
jgi:hypothetical protein